MQRKATTPLTATQLLDPRPRGFCDGVGELTCKMSPDERIGWLRDDVDVRLNRETPNPFCSIRCLGGLPTLIPMLRVGADRLDVWEDWSLPRVTRRKSSQGTSPRSSIRQMMYTP